MRSAGSAKHAEGFFTQARAGTAAADVRLGTLDELGARAGGAADDFGEKSHGLAWGRLGELGGLEVALAHIRVGRGVRLESVLLILNFRVNNFAEENFITLYFAICATPLAKI